MEPIEGRSPVEQPLRGPRPELYYEGMRPPFSPL